MAIINKTGVTNGGTIQAEHITRVIDALSGVSTDTIVATGSFTGSFNGSISGSSTSAQTVNTITSALNYEFYPTFVDANNGSATAETVYTDAGITYNPSTNILTTTASFALNAGGGAGFPFIGTAIITGSLIVSGSNNNVTFSTRNSNITAVDTVTISASAINITGDTQIDGRAVSTNWRAAAPSILDWQRAGEASDNGQFVLPIQAPTNPKTGTIYFDSGTKQIKIFDGTGWQSYDAAI